jgi:hypothetical protein
METWLVDLLTLSQLLAIVWVVALVILAVVLSRWLDARAGIRFREVVKQILAGNVAAGIYFGLRFLAICSLLAAAFF